MLFHGFNGKLVYFRTSEKSAIIVDHHRGSEQKRRVFSDFQPVPTGSSNTDRPIGGCYSNFSGPGGPKGHQVRPGNFPSTHLDPSNMAQIWSREIRPIGQL